jgi:murein tripeptide amidase MpaA
MSNAPLRRFLRSFALFGLALGCLHDTAGGAASGGSGSARVDFSGNSVVRLVPQDLRTMRLALALADDMWSHGAAVGKPLDLRVDAESLAAMRRAGLPIEVLIEDLEALIAAERSRLAERAEGGIAGGDAWFADFKTYAQINAKLDEFVAARPDICSVITFGTSLEGRAMKALRISNAPAGAPAILFNACQHAREWIAPMTVMYIADRLIAGASTDAAIVDLLGKAEIWIIPIVNPDGYQFSWDVNRLWRKNRRNNGNGTFGVDLNRNWDFQWGGGGASADPGSDLYRGPAPFSEPETQAMRDFYLARPTMLANIDFHSYSQLVLSPWGYTTDPAPDTAFMETVGERMADAIFDVNQVPYVAGPIATTLYIASGSSVDWAYGARGVYSYTVELRDTGTFGFILPPDQIIPTAEENFAGVMTLADEVLRPISISLPNGAPATAPTGGTAIAIATYDIAAETLPGGTLRWRDAADEPFSSVTVEDTGAGAWIALLPGPVCGATVEWYVEFPTTMGIVRYPDVPAEPAFVTAIIDSESLAAEEFETSPGPIGAWTVGVPGDNATSGVWTRVDPVGTIAQPEFDTTENGTLCFVTGQGSPGGSAGAADVDGGSTTLLSPIFDGSAPETHIRYDRWYSNDLGGAPNSDSMPVQISNDGGASWTNLEVVTENANAWVTRTFRLADVIAPTASMRVRFVARDLGSGSLVEAGIDGFEVFTLGCDATGDLDGDGDVDAADLAVLLGAWGPTGGAGSAADLDGDGDVDAADLAILLGAWTD